MMMYPGPAREQALLGGLLPLALLLAAQAALGLLGGCAKPGGPAEAPAPEAPAGPPRITCASYPNLCADEQRKQVLEAYLEAWYARESAPGPHAQSLERLLAVYRDAYEAMTPEAGQEEYDQRLRLLWDLCGVAHATEIPPERVKEATGWEEPTTPEGGGEAEVSLAEAAQRPVRSGLGGLPERCRALLGAVPLPRGEGTYLDYVKARARAVYFTAQIITWSPECPTGVCGTSEPLTRTLILMPAGFVDLKVKPDWSVAAVAVHECAHVEWFHRPEVSEDPRLLLPAPNERNAWLVMGEFLEGLLRIEEPRLAGYVEQERSGIQEKMRHAQEMVASANQALGLAANDRSARLSLPEGVQAEALRREMKVGEGE